jgi:2-iminobutanoate/2-iminopropanoate deaminase
MSTPVGPYSPVVRAGDWLVTSGQLGLENAPDGSTRLVAGGIVAQLRRALENVAGVLATQGAGLPDVRKATVFLTALGELAALNEVWTDAFGAVRPARSLVAVAALPLDALAEVEVWAYRPGA